MTKIHPTALISGDVTLGQSVEIGPFAIVNGPCRIGNGTKIDSHCLIGEGDLAFGATVIGENCHIRSHSIIYFGVEIGHSTQTGHAVVVRAESKIGANCMIGTSSDLQGNLTIGDHTRLHSDVHLCSGSNVGQFVFIYPRATFTNDKYPPSETTCGPTVGDFTQIGAGSLIMPGIEIGKHCLIAAHSVVTQNIGDDTFVKGSPAKSIGNASDLLVDGQALYPWPKRFARGMPWYDALSSDPEKASPFE